MCGIVGVASSFVGPTLEKVFYQLLWMDTLRGPHSTGVALKRTYGKEGPLVLKNMGAPDLGKLKTRVGFDAAIGHNRYATKGAVNLNNAHPFKCGDIVGVHNGTLSWMGELFGNGEFDTDSETIMNAIDKQGLEKTYSQLCGAWALVWFDNKDDSLNIIRNEHRELTYLYNGKDMVYASEPYMLLAALERNNMRKKGREFEGMTPILFTPHHHYKFKYNFKSGELERTIKALEEPKVKAPPVQRTVFVNRGNVNKNANNNGSNNNSSLSWFSKLGYDYFSKLLWIPLDYKKDPHTKNLWQIDGMTADENMIPVRAKVSTESLAKKILESDKNAKSFPRSIMNLQEDGKYITVTVSGVDCLVDDVYTQMSVGFDDGSVMTRSEWDSPGRKNLHHCAWCDDRIHWDDLEDAARTSPSCILCSTCCDFNNIASSN